VRTAHFGANRLYIHCRNRVAVREGCAARGADHSVFQVTADVGESNGRRGALLVLQRPLLNRAVDLAEVVDTGIHLRGRARFDEVRDGDCSQEADDGHHDHDFHQGETRFTRGFATHIVFCVFVLLFCFDDSV
jgi:hypothetical protein